MSTPIEPPTIAQAIAHSPQAQERFATLLRLETQCWACGLAGRWSVFAAVLLELDLEAWERIVAIMTEQQP